MNHESFSLASGNNVTGMREDFLQLAIGQDISILLCLVPSKKDGFQMNGSREHPQNGANELVHSDSSALALINEKDDRISANNVGVPNPSSLEIYLLDVFHKNFLVRIKEKQFYASKTVVPGQAPDDSCGLSHFCKTVAHRIFSNKVLAKIETLVRPFISNVYIQISKC